MSEISRMKRSNLFLNRTALATLLRKAGGISRGFASDLANGKRLPSLVLAAKFEGELGIPAAAWVAHQATCEAERQARAGQIVA